MWGLLKAVSQIFAGTVKDLVSPIPPVKAIRCVVYLSFVGYVGRRTVLSVVSGELGSAESLQIYRPQATVFLTAWYVVTQAEHKERGSPQIRRLPG
jgi:hypothetical protein